MIIQTSLITIIEILTHGIETVTFSDKPDASISAVAIQEIAELYTDIDEDAAKKIKSMI